MKTAYQFAVARDDSAEEVWLDAASLGVENIVRTRLTGATDTLAVSLTGQAALTDDPLWAYGTILRLRRSDTPDDGGAPLHTLLFLGRVQPAARAADGASEGQAVTLLGPWDWFERTVFRQDWTDADDIVHAAPRAILFWSNNARVTTGQQIGLCVAAAIAGGCPCAVPVPGDIAPGFTPPFDEQMNITVAQAVNICMANHPHAVCWFDYSERSPRFRVAARLDLPAVSLDIGADKELIQITSREDLQPPAVAICYQKPMADGENQWMYTSVDYAPVIPDETQEQTRARLSQAGVLWAVYDLAGFSAQYQEQEQSLEVERIDLEEHKTSRDWWARFCPHLNDPNITAVIITNPSGTGNLPNFLMSGVIEKWMGVEEAEDTFTADAQIIIGPPILPDEIRHEKLIFKKTTTDGHTKTYRKRTLTSADSGDSVPEGLAAQMWQEWRQLHHDGSITIVQTEAPLDIGPGKTLCLTGGRPEWITMLALVTRVTESFADGSTEVEFGTPQWIDIDSRFAFYKNCRNRRWSFTRNMSTPQESGEAEETDGDAAGITGIPGERDGHNPGITSVQHFHTPGASPGHSVLIDTRGGLFGFQFATPEDAESSRLVRVLEVLLPVAGPFGKVTGARRAQVLACAPYGDLVPLDAPGPQEGGGFGPVPNLPDPPPPIHIEVIDWLDGEPVIDLNSAAVQTAPVRLSSVIPGDPPIHWPVRFIAARFPAKGGEAESLGIVRGLPADEDPNDKNPLTARLAGVDDPPQKKEAQQLFGFASNGKWGLWELESLFKLDAANKRIYIDLAGYNNFKTLAADGDTWAFNADANLGGKNGATFPVVTDVSWDSENNKLIIKKRTVTLFKFGLQTVTAAAPTNVDVPGGHFDLRYDSASMQLQKQTQPDGGWDMISGGQFVEETV